MGSEASDKNVWERISCIIIIISIQEPLCMRAVGQIAHGAWRSGGVCSLVTVGDAINYSSASEPRRNTTNEMLTGHGDKGQGG